MVKIPTFKAQGTITGEAAGVVSGIQAPLSMASKFSGVQKIVADHAIKEKTIQDKTEALKLENDSIIELNGAVQQASKMMNKQQANEYLKTESLRIRNKYRDKASSQVVQRLFDTNYLMEEQKQIYKVDNAVYKNILQNNANEKSRKTERIMFEALYGDNPIQEKKLIEDLTKIEMDDQTQDDDVRAANIAAIPGKIDYFKAKKSMNDDPTQTLKDLRDTKGPYQDLPLQLRQQLERDALSLAKPAMQDKVKDHFAKLEAGIESKLSHTDVKEILGNNAYENFAEIESGILRTRDFKKNILNSKIGDENKIIESFKIRPDAAATDLKLKKQLIDIASKKAELLKKDPASLIIQSNDQVKELFNDYSSEQDESKKAIKFKKYIDGVKQAQIDMGLYSDQIKVMPNSQANAMVEQYNRITDPNEKIAYLNNLEEQYGNNFSNVLMHLSEQGLPSTAKLVSYFGDRNFALQSLSIDSPEERKRLDNFLTGTDTSKSEVMRQVSEELADFRSVVFQANPFDTSKANKEFDDITNLMTYITINKMSTGKDLTTAAEEATDIINNNFDLRDTYFIPRIYNNDQLPQTQIDFIAEKANLIKTKYIDALDLLPFKSTDKNVSDEELNEAMKSQVRSNGMWLNKADGDGIFLAVKFANGEYGEVLLKSGKRIEMNFDDGTFLIPGTTIQLDLAQIADEAKLEIEGP